MFNKKIINEVLNVKCFGKVFFKNKNTIVINIFSGSRTAIIEVNIYEFIYKCKVWAWENLYIIGTIKKGNKKWECFIEESLGFNTGEFYGDDELESILKACEHIIKNKKRKIK